MFHESGGRGRKKGRKEGGGGGEDWIKKESERVGKREDGMKRAREKLK